MMDMLMEPLIGHSYLIRFFIIDLLLISIIFEECDGN